MNSEIFFDIICFIVICICLHRIAELNNRLEMNIIVVQSLQKQIDSLENK
jgi:hypothetical protein